MTPRIKTVFSALLITLCWTSGGFAQTTEEWEQVAVGQFDDGINAIAYGGGQFVAVGSGSFVATSPDGVVWTQRSPVFSAFYNITDYTQDGRPTWDDLKKDYFASFTGIAFGNGLFVMAGINTPIFSSKDGINWYAETSGFERNFRGVDYGGGLFVASTDSGAIWTSTGDGNWEVNGAGPTTNLNSATYGYGPWVFVAVGDKGTIISALDPESYAAANQWILRESNTTNTLLSVTHGNGVFVVTSMQGTILTSSDGIHWQERSLGSGSPLNGIAWGKGTFVVVGAATNTGDGANLWTSPDGKNWTRGNGVVNKTLKGIAFDGEHFVAVGEGGTIIRSGSESHLINFSNRAFVGSGNEVLIGSLKIADAPLRIYARVVGPSLASSITNPLFDPQLELIQILPTGNIQIGTNFDWRTEQEALIQSTGIPPADDLEPAIVKTLQPGTYSIVVRGVGGTTGFANVEIYEFPDSAEAVQGRLTNLSNRAFVGTGDNTLIGSFIIRGNVPRRIYARVAGPSLPASITNRLINPSLELVQIVTSGNITIATNDSWRDEEVLVISTGIPPANDLEPAIVKTLEPGTYSIVVKGVGGTEGVANVEIYDFPEP